MPILYLIQKFGNKENSFIIMVNVLYNPLIPNSIYGFNPPTLQGSFIKTLEANVKGTFLMCFWN